MPRSLLSIIGLTTALVLLAGACGGEGDNPFAPGATVSTGDSGDTADNNTADDNTAGDDTANDGAPVGVDRSAELVGRWNIINYVLPDGGGLTNVVGSEQPYIEFLTDGSVGYHTGCNGGSGSYATSGTYLVPDSALDDTPEGQPITLGPAFQQTEIGCEGFLGDQDLDLPANFGAASRFILRDGELLLLDEFILVIAVGG
jgi:hypothetical protein